MTVQVRCHRRDPGSGIAKRQMLLGHVRLPVATPRRLPRKDRQQQSAAGS
jgi:hypothetical protein